jgi:hypothetical protein
LVEEVDVDLAELLLERGHSVRDDTGLGE